jgi:crotonobetainyl-CoA:carnitine CoA-transferase CaiB-like acyl-CoA transferase
MTLGLTQKEGKEILHRLVARFDVFLSALRIRQVVKFDIEYETLKR